MITTINEFKQYLNESKINIPYHFTQLKDINGNIYSFNENGTKLIINDNWFTFNNSGIFKNKSPKIYGRGVLIGTGYDKDELKGIKYVTEFESFIDMLLETPINIELNEELNTLSTKLKMFLEIKK